MARIKLHGLVSETITRAALIEEVAWNAILLLGHGERLGKSWPRTKVPVLKEIPSNEDFFRDYVAKRSPVVMEKVLDEITDLGSRFFGINLR